MKGPHKKLGSHPSFEMGRLRTLMGTLKLLVIEGVKRCRGKIMVLYQPPVEQYEFMDQLVGFFTPVSAGAQRVPQQGRSNEGEA